MFHRTFLRSFTSSPSFFKPALFTQRSTQALLQQRSFCITSFKMAQEFKLKHLHLSSLRPLPFSGKPNSNLLTPPIRRLASRTQSSPRHSIHGNDPRRRRSKRPASTTIRSVQRAAGARARDTTWHERGRAYERGPIESGCSECYKASFG